MYLDELDQFVKRRLRVRHYVRYVDDMLLLSTSRAELTRWREEIAEFLGRRLRLRLRADMGEPERAAGGIDFVGWRTWPTRRAVRRRTLESFDRRLGEFEGEHVQLALGGLARRIDLDRPGTPAALQRLRSSLASTSGHLRQGSMADWTRVFGGRGWLGALFERSGFRIEPRWAAPSPAAPRSFAASYAGLVRRAGPRGLVFLRVGRFIELYGLQRLLALRVLRLRPVRLPRAGFALLAGFPWRLAWRERRAALSAGVFVLEAEHRRAGPRGAAGADLRAVRVWIPNGGYGGVASRWATIPTRRGRREAENVRSWSRDRAWCTCGGAGRSGASGDGSRENAPGSRGERAATLVARRMAARERSTSAGHRLCHPLRRRPSETSGSNGRVNVIDGERERTI